MAKIDLGKLKLSFEGNWDATLAYEKDDMVEHGGKLWVMKKTYLPNGFETFAPGDRGFEYKNHKKVWNTRNRTEGYLESDDEIAASHAFDDSGNFHYNHKPVENSYEVERKDIGGSVMRYWIAGIQENENLGSPLDGSWGTKGGLYEMGHFNFYQNQENNQAYALDFSTTADGTHGAGTTIWTSGTDSPLKYFLNGDEVTQAYYVTTFATTAEFGRNKHRARRVELRVPVGLIDQKIYPFCQATAGLYNSKGITVDEGWIGHEYWDLLANAGMTYRGPWDGSEQYYWGDIVSYRFNSELPNHAITGETVKEHDRNSATVGFYRALSDNVKSPPWTSREINKARSRLMSHEMGTGKGGAAITTAGGHRFFGPDGVPSETQGWNCKWEEISGGVSNDQACVWGNNMGRIGWPFKEPNNSNFETYRSRAMIDEHGTVWNLGRGPTGSAEAWSGHTSDGIGYWFEMDFTFHDQRQSEDMNWHGTNDHGIKGTLHRSRKTNPTEKGHTPRCVQIIRGYGWHYWLFDNGEVHHKGYGGHGQAGHGQYSNNTRPNRVENLDDVHIVKIASNTQNETNSHSMLALDDKGRVWTWGYSGNGQAGNGRTEHWGAPYQIPSHYFEDKRIIDIALTGHTSSSCWARTTDDHLYCWGENGGGQFCQNNTTNYYRPVKWSGRSSIPWDPEANNGMASFQIAGYGANQTVWILDGNGFVWHGGHNGYGQAGGSDTTNHQDSPEKMTSTPNGDIVDIWGMHYNSYIGLWMRTTDGSTYHSGHSGSMYLSGDGGTGDNTPPVQITKIKNLKEVFYCGTYSDQGMTWWLTDEGECYAQGRKDYNDISNPLSGNNWTGEDGTYKPYHQWGPAGCKIAHIIPQGIHQGTSYYGMMPWYITEDGQTQVIGFSGHSTNDGNHCGGHNSFNYNSNNNGQMINPGIGR